MSDSRKMTYLVVINVSYKVQYVTVVTYLRCGGIINSQIKKGLLQSPAVEFFKRLIFRIVTDKKVDCAVHFLRLL